MPVAANCCEVPWAIDRLAGVTEITVRVACEGFPPVELPPPPPPQPARTSKMKRDITWIDALQTNFFIEYPTSAKNNVILSYYKLKSSKKM